MTHTNYNEFVYSGTQCVFIAKVARNNEMKVSSVLLVIMATDDEHKLFRLESANDWVNTAVLIEQVIEVLRGNTDSHPKECIAEWLRNAGVLP